MRTDLPPSLLTTKHGKRADEILRSCVHCGFCNATCPTYQLTGDELDGPRGRIYLIRDLLEGGGDAARSRLHLDRCLTCRACETTCPSGVAFGELAEIARNELGAGRKGLKGLLRQFVQWLVPDTARLRRMSRLGRVARPFLPRRLSKHVPPRGGIQLESAPSAERNVLLLNGCAQQVATPKTNLHLMELLARRGIGVEVVPEEGCCGALDQHLGDESRTLKRVRHNVDVLSPYLDRCEAIISTASGCGVTIKDYGRLLDGDAEYAGRAHALSSACVDVAEYLSQAGFEFAKSTDHRRIAWHPPCTLQHGMQLQGVVEQVLTRVGYELVAVRDAHLCCGSAGSYSILEPAIADTLGHLKAETLYEHDPGLVATANVGCQTHLSHASGKQIVHWIELIN